MDAIGSHLHHRPVIEDDYEYKAPVVYTRGPRATPGSSEVKARRTRIYDP